MTDTDFSQPCFQKDHYAAVVAVLRAMGSDARLITLSGEGETWWGVKVSIEDSDPVEDKVPDSPDAEAVVVVGGTFALWTNRGPAKAKPALEGSFNRVGQDNPTPGWRFTLMGDKGEQYVHGAGPEDAPPEEVAKLIADFPYAVGN